RANLLGAGGDNAPRWLVRVLPRNALRESCTGRKARACIAQGNDIARHVLLSDLREAVERDLHTFCCAQHLGEPIWAEGEHLRLSLPLRLEPCVKVSERLCRRGIRGLEFRLKCRVLCVRKCGWNVIPQIGGETAEAETADV